MEKRTNKMGIDNQKTSFEHQSLEVSMLDKDNFSDEELDSYLSKGEIKATDKVTIPPKILFVGDCTIATFGNFSASTGKAKSKKTFNISAMVAAAVTNTTVLNYRACLPEGKRKILYFDTEQSKYHCHTVLERIYKLSGLSFKKDDPRLMFWGLREYTPKLRIALIDYALRKYDEVGLVIIEVGVDIRKVHTVRVKETLKQQVVFQRVDPGYAQAISHHRSCGRATARTYPYAQIVTCSIDKVLHDKEITWEAHCLHGVKLEVDVLTHILGHRVAIEFLGSLVCQFSQIVGFKLNAVKFVDTAQQFYLLASFLGWQGILAILVGRKLLIDFLVRVPLAPQFLCAKTLRNREKRHDGSMVDAIDLHLI